MLNMKKKLKSYVIKTKITIREHRGRYREGNEYVQPLEGYSYEIDKGNYITSYGGFKTKKLLIRDLVKHI